ncbi:MAG: flagellar basal body-associated protein FliL [Betaproteobacteria bacterium]
MAGRGKNMPDEAGRVEKAQEKGPVAAKAKGGMGGGGLTPGLVMLGVALVFIATMGSAFLAVTFLGRNGGGQQAPASAAEQPKAQDQFGPTQAIGDFTVNLADDGERVYLKAGVAVELSNAEAQTELTSRDPQVKDIVISVLSAKTMVEVAGRDGKEVVKKEIRDRLNRLLTKGRVRNVFFTEFVFQ